MYCFAFGFVSYQDIIGRNTIPNGCEPTIAYLKMSLLFGMDCLMKCKEISLWLLRKKFL